MTRHATTTHIAAGDLVFLRYGIPALVLLPIAWRMGLLPRGLSPRRLALLVVGAGLPFGLIAMSGTRYAPSAHMGVLMAGAVPLFTAALAFALWRDRPRGWRAMGLASMTAGVAILGGKALGGGAADVLRGDSLFLVAAGLWAGFTLAFRGAGLTPWQGAALVNAWSALLLLPWLALGAHHLLEAPDDALVVQALWQGLVAGLLGLWTVNVAIDRLGAAPAAAFGALAPVVSALGGWCWLGDALGVLDVAALVLAVCGVALASGAIGRQR
jgi:drug/metabolite transporter (DMT)-like permease